MASTNPNPISKAFLFPNILFIGVPMLLLTFVMGSVITTGKSMVSSFPTVYYALTFYIYGVFVYHTYNALDKDDSEMVKDAGIAGIICSLSTIVVQRLHSNQYYKYTDDMVLVASVLLLIGVSVYSVIDTVYDDDKTTPTPTAKE